MAMYVEYIPLSPCSTSTRLVFSVLYIIIFNNIILFNETFIIIFTVSDSDISDVDETVQNIIEVRHNMYLLCRINFIIYS